MDTAVNTTRQCSVSACERPLYARAVFGPSAKNVVKTRCPNGHEYTPENTRQRDDHPTWRECWICHRAATRSRKALARSIA